MNLGDVCEVIMGQAPAGENYNESGEGYPLIAGAGDLGEMNPHPKRFSKIATKLNQIGDIILCIRATIGNKNWADKVYCLGRGVAAIRSKDADEANIKYIWHWLSANNEKLLKKAKGATFQQVTKKDIEELPCDLPPLSEQKRIAAILDKVDDIIRKRKQSIKLLDELVKAKFVDMFGDLETNEKGWEILNLADISEIKIGPFGTMLHQSDYIKNGYPVINPSNILDSEIIPDINFTISDAKYNSLLPYKLEMGDIVLGRRGEMGRCAVAKISNMLCGTGCVRIRLSDGFEPDFIQFSIASPFYKKLLSNNSVGITMQNLNMDILAGLPIYKIPYAWQKKFILFLSKISAIKMQLNLAIQDSMKVKDSLIIQFFTIDR